MDFAVNRWPLGRTHTSLEECTVLVKQFEHYWKKEFCIFDSSVGLGKWWMVLGIGQCSGEHPEVNAGSFRFSAFHFPVRLTMMFFVFPSSVLVGKPSSFFPEDSFIDSGEIDVGRRASQKIPPGTFWRSQVFIDHPVHLKFNVSLGKAALVGIYGRKGLPPSHTQVT